jgi:hydrogenase maturation protease
VSRVLLAGVGNEWRRDDAVGPVVAARALELRPELRSHCVIEVLADPLDLLGEWDGTDLAVVVDAMRSGSPVGTVTEVFLRKAARSVAASDAGSIPGSEASGPDTADRVTTTHGIGIAGAFRLAVALGQAPLQAVVVGIEGADFGHGRGLTPGVQSAVDVAASTVLRIVDDR